MGFLIFLCGTVFGGFLGVVIMCCLQINRINKFRKKTDGKEKERGGV